MLVNNAGVNAGGYRKPSEENAQDTRYVFETNVFAVVAVTNAFLPWLLKAPAGRIVNVTSKRGSIGEEGARVAQNRARPSPSGSPRWARTGRRAAFSMLAGP